MKLINSTDGKIDEISDATETARKSNAFALAGTVRLVLGVKMMIAGLYFWLFDGGNAEGLGLLFLISSPFVILTDKKADESPVFGLNKAESGG